MICRKRRNLRIVSVICNCMSFMNCTTIRHLRATFPTHFTNGTICHCMEASYVSCLVNLRLYDTVDAALSGHPGVAKISQLTSCPN